MSDTSLSVNDTAYDWGSVETTTTAGAHTFKGIKSIAFKTAMEGAEAVYGAGRRPFTTTIGTVKFSGSIEVYKAEAAAFRAALDPSNSGYMVARTGFSVAYGNNGQPLMYDTIKRCRVIESDNSHGGGGALTVKFTLLPLDIEENGAKPVPQE